MKKFRNENGELTMSIDQIKKETRGEALDYYRPGKLYLNAKDGTRIRLSYAGSR